MNSNCEHTYTNDIYTIQFDHVQNAFIDNLGNCYQTITDIQEQFNNISWVEHPVLSKFYCLQEHVIRV